MLLSSLQNRLKQNTLLSLLAHRSFKSFTLAFISLISISRVFPSPSGSALSSKTSWVVDGPAVFSSLSKAESWTLDLDFLGDFRFLAEADFHSKIDGTALSRSVRIPDRDTLKSASLKCLEHTRVFSFILKCRPMSLRIARIHSSQIFSPTEI